MPKIEYALNSNPNNEPVKKITTGLLDEPPKVLKLLGSASGPLYETGHQYVSEPDGARL
jgi:hypothetical protein